MPSNNDISLGNILQHFPELLVYILPFIADRTVFNSIASCDSETNEKSKLISPPWPINYRFPASDDKSVAVWASDGTRVAYRCQSRNIIAIVDQRQGIIHRINNNRGVSFCDLKFSPDGRFLVSADDNDIVKLWDNNIAGNYGLLQEWNMREDIGGLFGQDFRIDISACSNYVLVFAKRTNRVVFISVENGETFRFLTPQPVMNIIRKVMFSLDYRTVFIYGRCENSSVIKLWRPYQNETDEDNLITLWRQKFRNFHTNIIISHDKTMIAIQDTVDLNKGRMVSVENKYSCTVYQLKLQTTDELLQFTPDDEFIIFATKKGLKYWSVAGKKFTDKEYVLNDEKYMKGPRVVNCSPNNRQFIVYNDIKEGDSSLYMKSIF